MKRLDFLKSILAIPFALKQAVKNKAKDSEVSFKLHEHFHFWRLPDEVYCNPERSGFIMYNIDCVPFPDN